MEATVVAAAIAGLAVATTSLVTWRVAKRQRSGQVGTSDAATLWAASEQIRLELRAEVVDLRAQAVVLLAKIDRLEKRLADLSRG